MHATSEIVDAYGFLFLRCLQRTCGIVVVEFVRPDIMAVVEVVGTIAGSGTPSGGAFVKQ